MVSEPFKSFALTGQRRLTGCEAFGRPIWPHEPRGQARRPQLKTMKGGAQTNNDTINKGRTVI